MSTATSSATKDDLPFHSKGFVNRNNLPLNLTGVLVAATITTSASTLPPQPILIGSAVSDVPVLYASRRARYSSQSAIAAFTEELKKKGKSLSSEDSQLLRKIILSKSKPGIPRF